MGGGGEQNEPIVRTTMSKRERDQDRVSRDRCPPRRLPLTSPRREERQVTDLHRRISQDVIIGMFLFFVLISFKY